MELGLPDLQFLLEKTPFPLPTYNLYSASFLMLGHPNEVVSEMAQWVKCLFYNHGVLSSDPQQPYKVRCAGKQIYL